MFKILNKETSGIRGKLHRCRFKFVLLCLMVVVLLAGVGLPAYADIPIKVVASWVNLRSTPKALQDNSNVIGHVEYGQKFVAIDKQSDSTYGAWYKIAYPSASGPSYGWVAQKNKQGSLLTQEDSSLSSRIVVIRNDGGRGWRLRVYIDSDPYGAPYLCDVNKNALKVWNGEKFIYASCSQSCDGCYWWEIYIPYLDKAPGDWPPSFFVRDDAIRPTGSITGKVYDRAGRGIAGASVIPYLKDGHNDSWWNSTTSSNGSYTCQYLPESNYTLKVTASGFIQATVNVSVTSGQTTTKDIYLDETTPPTISNVRIDPNTLSSSGGTVTIRADVTDNVAVSSVTARITKPDGSTTDYSMSKESGNTYKVTYSAPANSTSQNQRYYVRIKALDASNNSAESSNYYFDVLAGSSNQPPSKPSNPSPPDGATDQPTSLTLSWSSSGATEYDLYFGTSSNPPLYKSSLTSSQLSVSNLQENTTYYWKVVAKNQYGSTAGDIWRFTTKKSSVSGRFQIGDRVSVTYAVSPEKLKVRSSRRTDINNIIDTKPPGGEGEILEGPASSEGGNPYTWWKIRWDNGTIGWSVEGVGSTYYLEALPGKGTYSSGVSHNGLSYRVRVYDDTSPAGGLHVRKGPGKSYEVIKTQPVGARGWTLDEDPYTSPSPCKSDKMIWWLIKWDDGTIGWSADSRLDEGVFLVKEQAQPFSRVAVLSNSPGSTIDFGTVKPGEYKDYSITIQNDSASTGLLTGSISVSGTGFTLLASNSFKRLPGEIRVITVRFQPSSSGDYSGTLSITHNATNYNSPITYSLKGKGSSDAKSVNINYPSSLNFGSVKLNSTVEQIVHIENLNTSTDKLTISNIKASGEGFKLSSGQPTSFELSPGSSYDIKIQFQPTQEKSYSGTLTFEHNATNISSPISIPLYGSGTTNYYTLTVDTNITSDATIWVNDKSYTLPYKGQFAEGSSITLKAEASGYDFSGWTGDISSKNNPLTLVMNKDTSLRANFVSASSTNQVKLTLYSSPQGGGQIRIQIDGIWTEWGNSLSKSLSKGTKVIIEAKANNGFKFYRWSGDGVPYGSETSNPLTITVNGNYQTYAKFLDVLPPLISAASVEPSTLDKPAGEVSISATVTDNDSLSEVKAIIKGASGKVDEIKLGKSEDNTYTATYRVENSSTDKAQYVITIRAVDNSGNHSEKQLELTVAGNQTPPPPKIVSPNSNSNLQKDQKLVVKIAVDSNWINKLVENSKTYIYVDISITPPGQEDSIKLDTYRITIEKNKYAFQITPTYNGVPYILSEGGRYELRIVLKDQDGNTSPPALMSFDVYKQPSSPNEDHLVPIQNEDLKPDDWDKIYTNQVYDTAVDSAKDFVGSNACGPTSAVMALAILGKLPPHPIEGRTSQFGWYVANEYTYKFNGIQTTFNRTAPDGKKHPKKGFPGAHGWIVNSSGIGEVSNHGVGIIPYLEKHGVNANWTEYAHENSKGQWVYDHYISEDLSVIKENIDKKRLPVIVTLVLSTIIDTKTGLRGGHFTLIVGYGTNENGETELIFLDPFGRWEVDNRGYVYKIHKDPSGGFKFRHPPNFLIKRIITLEKLDGTGQVVAKQNSKRDEVADSQFEPNDSPDKAVEINYGQEIMGVIGQAGDVDFFKFNGAEGDVVSVFLKAEQEGSPLDAILTLYDSDGQTILTQNDDNLELPTVDPYILHYKLPHSGSFYIRVSSFDGSGSAEHFYRLSLRREVEDDFGDSFDTANSLNSSNQVIEGTIGHYGDVDVFKFEAARGEYLNLDVRARRDNSPLDPVIELYNSNFELIDRWDDVNGYDPTVRTYKIPETGTYYLKITDFDGDGGSDFKYKLSVEIQPPPQMTVDTTPINESIQMGTAKELQQKVQNAGGGFVDFASVGEEATKSRGITLPNPCGGLRKIIFVSPTDFVNQNREKHMYRKVESSNFQKREKAPSSLSKPSSEQPIVLPLPLGRFILKRSATRDFPAPSPDNWRWIIADPPETTVEGACNINKVYMQRTDQALYFKVETAGNSFLDTDMLLMFFLDTDFDPNSGVGLFTNFGADYLILLGEELDGVWKWNDSTGEFEPLDGLGWKKIDSNIVEVGIPLSDIGNAEQFSLFTALDDAIAEEIDLAPDESFVIITKLPDWLKVEPLGGTMGAGRDTPMTLTLDANNFDTAKEINGVLKVYSRDPNMPETEIPIKLNVQLPQFPFESKEGLHMISLPISPDKKWHEIMGLEEDKMQLAIYDPTVQNYRYYKELSEEEKVPKPGQGVWVKLDNPLQTTISGIPPKGTQPFLINLKQGWQIIGTPWQVKWANIKVRKDTEELPLPQAAEKGWVYEVLWAWDSQACDYQMVWGGALGLGVLDTLDTFKGYWLMAMEDCQLVIPPKDEATKAKSSKRQLAKNGFVFGLTADDGKVKRRVWLGFMTADDNRKGLQVPLPPPSPQPASLQIYALSTNGIPLAADVRGRMTDKMEWDIVVEWIDSKEIVLTFDGVGYAPKGVGLWLLDTATGKRTYLRTIGAYRFTPSPEETERRFKIIAEREISSSPWIVGLKATPVRGEGVVVSFSLAKPAQVKVEIQNLNGQRIAVLGGGEFREAGEQKFVWRGVNEKGEKVPAGVYLIRVLVRDEESRQAQAITMTTIR